MSTVHKLVTMECNLITILRTLHPSFIASGEKVHIDIIAVHVNLTWQDVLGITKQTRNNIHVGIFLRLGTFRKFYKICTSGIWLVCHEVGIIEIPQELTILIQCAKTKEMSGGIRIIIDIILVTIFDKDDFLHTCDIPFLIQ